MKYNNGTSCRCAVAIVYPDKCPMVRTKGMAKQVKEQLL